MYLQKAKKGSNKWWMYLSTVLIVIFFSQIFGSIPIGVLIGIAAVRNGGEIPAGDMMLDPTAMGIDQNLFLALIVIPFAMGLLGLWIGIKYIHHKRFIDVLTAYANFNWRKVGFAALIWGALFIIYIIITLIVDGGNYTFQLNVRQFFILLFVAFLFIPLQSTFEEVLFRGYLMQGTALLFKNKWFPLIITSILFGSLHAVNPEVKEFGFAVMLPQYIFFGLVFGIMVLMDEGLELAIGVHAINNIFSALFITHESSVLQTPALFQAGKVYPVLDFIVLIIMSLLFLWIMAIKYKWNKFNYLFEKVKF